MGDKSKRKKTTAADLPEELLRQEILTRLPIKSVVRFKSVCKSWVSLFSQPQFVEDHKTRNVTQNPIEYDCVIADKGTKLVILTRYKETKLLSYDNMSFLIGSVNGLVCLRRGNNFSLWNPAIHQSKEFTIPAGYSRVYGYFVGCGFDSVSNNFKVVVFSSDLRSAVVYYSGLDSWREVIVGENVFPEDGYKVSNADVIVKGCPYWTCSKYIYETETFGGRREEMKFLVEAYISVVKFDVETDEFKLFPEFHFKLEYEGGYKFCYKLVDMKDRLTLIMHDENSANCVLEIFSVCGEEEGCGVWSKMIDIGPLYFNTRGWYVSLPQGFQSDGEILFHENGMFACIDQETDVVKRLRGTSSSDYAISCFRYVPTLVFIQGMKSVYLTTQTRRPGCYKTPRRLIRSLND